MPLWEALGYTLGYSVCLVAMASLLLRSAK